jgi:hypothetical protein
MPGTLVHPVAIAALLAAGLTPPAGAQRPGIRPAEPTIRFELFPFAGYQFGGGLNVTGGHVSLGDGLSYGGYLDVLTRKGTWVQRGLGYWAASVGPLLAVPDKLRREPAIASPRPMSCTAANRPAGRRG